MLADFFMPNTHKSLQIHKFGNNDPLAMLPQDACQVRYLRDYFADLGALVIVEEPNYFDRDYLSEYANFYSTSAEGYENVCRRLHIFSDASIDRGSLISLAMGESEAKNKFQQSYLGFVVIRPIPQAPLGRTVVKWYPDEFPDTPRVTTPSRSYKTHLLGTELQIQGLAWQQQDTGVGACATIGIWTMLHSSAFDDHHAIPTTAEITRSAHKTASLGARVFPSSGLTIYQICEAIKEQNLSPLVVDGDIKLPNFPIPITEGFSTERFASSCAAFIRSGYPVLLIGKISAGGHAVVAVGFRSSLPTKIPAGHIALQDKNINYIYLHDDNLGPSVRFSVQTNSSSGVVELHTDPPPPKGKRINHPSPTEGYSPFIPQQLVVAVHNDLRTSSDVLNKKGIEIASRISQLLQVIATNTGTQISGVAVSTRFMKIAKYFGDELGRTLGGDLSKLASVRMALSENVSPMSLHVGVLRLGLDDSTPLLDVIYDTTDSDRNHPAFAHICYAPIVPNLVDILIQYKIATFGVRVSAF
jgi:hypothetical protein